MASDRRNIRLLVPLATVAREAATEPLTASVTPGAALTRENAAVRDDATPGARSPW